MARVKAPLAGGMHATVPPQCWVPHVSLIKLLRLHGPVSVELFGWASSMLARGQRGPSFLQRLTASWAEHELNDTQRMLNLEQWVQMLLQAEADQRSYNPARAEDLAAP